ncbi:DHS-like NAD/FAD-binding domain-containing protein [Xylariales sp. PMI_506]|nr:DHS-like NAD/FAD-binding domain-containing protein [Xylariales sp. PMI_506]
MANLDNLPTPVAEGEALADFHEALHQSSKIIAVLGAGLSASSGLPTYRGAGSGGLWRNHDATQIATPAAFQHDPGLVWQYNSHLRRLALTATPNQAHYALAELARRIPGFVALSQNVDNLSQRAGHPPAQLKQLHGNLFDLRCCDETGCGYFERGNFKDPLTPALGLDDNDSKHDTTLGNTADKKRLKATAWLLEGIAKKNRQILGKDYQDSAPTGADQAPLKSADDSDNNHLLTLVPEPSNIAPADLPQCPKCLNSLLRPSVVWFGEALPANVMEEVETLFTSSERIDLCIVIGTSGIVWPAAGYADFARKKGARIAVVNMEASDIKNMRPGADWVFVGDAASVVPQLLRPLVGELNDQVLLPRE